MESDYPLAFGPFHVDGPQGGLWQGAQAIVLRPQALALLRYLVAHPGRLVSKAEVRQHVWAGTHVTDAVLRVCVSKRFARRWAMWRPRRHQTRNDPFLDQHPLKFRKGAQHTQK